MPYVVFFSGVAAIAILGLGTESFSASVGSTLTLAAAVMLLVAFCAEMVDDARADLEKVRKRAKEVEALAVAIGLPGALIAGGATFSAWSIAVLVFLCLGLAVLFATTRKERHGPDELQGRNDA